MASLTGTAHNLQDLWDLSKRALIQGGGSTTIHLFESTNARGATDGILVYSGGTASGPEGSILGPAKLCDGASPRLPPLTAQPQDGNEHTPTRELAHGHLSDLIWGLQHTRRTASSCTDTEEPPQARAETLEWREWRGAVRTQTTPSSSPPQSTSSQG